MDIDNYRNCEISDLTYGGYADKKLGVICEGEYYMMKFPKNGLNLKNTEIPCTTSSLSEYIGSQIYNILGIPVHDTKLGIYHNKLVVLCKDIEFDKMTQITRLNVFANILNVYDKSTFEKYSHSGDTRLNYILNCIKNNYLVNNVGVPKVLERFWTMFIIDTLIHNNNRNNEDWGLLVTSENVDISPVFDNGNSFNTHFPPKDICSNFDKMNDLQCTQITSIFKSNDGNHIMPYDFFRETPHNYCF